MRFFFLLIALFITVPAASGWIEVSKADADQRQSTVAFYNNQFLVCWSDGRDYQTDSAATIRACRISANGTVLDPNSFLVEGGDIDKLVPKVCTGNSDWVVIWHQGC